MTDSACSLPDALAKSNGITVVPMWVTIAGQQHRDGEVDLREVIRRLGDGVSTSCPAPGELATAIEGADQGDGVVVLTVAQRMSGTYLAAKVAAGGREGREVVVVDTGTAAGAQGLVVLAASQAARAGAGLEEVVSEAQAAARRTKLLATVPSLAYLARSGRVPGAAAWGAKWLGLSPLFEFREGKVWPLRPARGGGAACARMVAAVRREAGREVSRGAVLHVATLHALEPAPAESLLASVSELVAPASAFVGSFSSVMVCHTGPGLVGLAWRWAAVQH